MKNPIFQIRGSLRVVPFLADGPGPSRAVLLSSHCFWSRFRVRNVLVSPRSAVIFGLPLAVRNRRTK